MTQNITLHRKPDWRWGVAGAVVAVLAVLLVIDPRTFLTSYLTAWFAVSSVPIGSMGLLMTSYLIRGRWTYDAHRPLACGSLAMPVASVLFIPVMLGVVQIYPWATSSEGLSDFQQWLFTPLSFVIRSIVYLVILSLIGRWAAFSGPGRQAQMGVASIGLIVWVPVVSLAGIDWAESVEPHFHSSIYGLLVVSFTVLSACAYLLVALGGTVREKLAGPEVYGGILLTMLLIWAYLHAMQYIIIWAGNLPDEVIWYLNRLAGGWAYLLWGLYLVQFAAPFLLLLSSHVRKSWRALLWLGALTLGCRFVEAAILIHAGLDHRIPLLLLALPLALIATAIILIGAQIVPSRTAPTGLRTR